MNSWIIQVIFSRLVVAILKCHIERESPAKKSIVRVIDGLSIFLVLLNQEQSMKSFLKIL